MEPSGQLHRVQVLCKGGQAIDGAKHGQDMIERVVEAAWASVGPANVIELLVGLDGFTPQARRSSRQR